MVTGRLVGRVLLGMAVAASAGLFVFGVWLYRAPRFRGDPWVATAMCGLAAVNVAALLVRGGAAHARLRARLQRIALLVNGLLLSAGLLAVAGTLRTRALGGPETLFAFGLLVPPAAVLAAIWARRRWPGRRPQGLSRTSR